MNYKNLIVLIFLIPFITVSQNSNKKISFRSLNIEDGLSQNSVTSIAQDSLGYLWLATQDGLNKYDGKSFKLFNKQFEDVTRSTYSKLGKTYIDRKGVLWIISNSGQLEKFDSRLQNFTNVSIIKDVSTVFQSSRGDFFIGTYGKGLYKIDYKSKDTTRIFESKIANEWLFEIIEDKHSILIASSKSIFRLTDSGLERLKLKESSENFSSLVISEDQTIWLGTFGNGLFYKRKDQNEFVKYNGFNGITIPANLNIQDLMVDRNNRLWVATYGSGVYVIDIKSQTSQHFITNIRNPFALHYNDVLCMYEDYTGTIWLGTDGAGLSYFDEHLNKFNLISNDLTPDNVVVDVVRSITVDDNKTMWFGTSGKGLSSINLGQNQYKTFTTKNSKIASNRIMSLLYFENELWIGHQSNGIQIRDNDGKFSEFPELSNLTIWKIYKDSKNQIWLCTRDNGLILFNKNEGVKKRFNANNSLLTSNNIRTIEEGNQNTLWIGTEDDGLFQLKTLNNEITRIGIIQDKIKSLYFDEDKLWIGTNGNGLKSYNLNSDSVDTYDVNYEFSNNVIYGVLPDNKGNLWLSSNKGISKFNPKDENRFFIENYKKSNGLQAFEFNTGAYFKDKDGILYFGGLKGVNWFDPNSITKNRAKPKTVISKFEVFGQEQLLLENSSFRHDQNTMTFTFAGLHFSQPEQNLYRYQLLNHDEDISHPSLNNVAHYTNLPPNDYTFFVSSSNYDGVWNKEEIAFNFKILNPWYLTLTAKFIYAGLTLLLLLGVYRYFKFRWNVKMQLQLEHAETERLKKLDEFKTKLYTNISHEFRTPLTLISGPIDEQLSKSKLSDNDREQFELIQRNSERLLSLVNQLLDLSKLETGSLKLSVAKGNLSVLLKQLVSLFEYKSKEKNIVFNVHIESMGNVWFDKEVIEKVLTNLLANAVKYAPQNGYVNFEAKITDGQLITSIVNNGNKLSNRDLTKLFQRFYQTNKNSDGVGIGLALVKELVLLSHGNVVANTMNEDDIQFTVTLPISRVYFNDSEIIASQDSISTEEPLTTTYSEIEENTQIDSNRPIVLVVEDEKDIRLYISSIIKKDYTIIEAKNGDVGVNKAIKHIPDLIISDVMMPIKNGIDLCKELKSDVRTSHIPIILLTAKVGEENEIEGLKTGADAYITKPFNREKLKIQIENLISIRQQLQEKFGVGSDFKLKDLKLTTLDEQFFVRLTDLLNTHISEPDFNVQKFSDAMRMSRMQLHRKLIALTGYTTSEFLRIQRLKLAIQLLESSDLNISEIAYQVGFNTPSYFIKMFKKIYNCTPSEYISKA